MFRIIAFFREQIFYSFSTTADKYLTVWNANSFIRHSMCQQLIKI